MSLLDSIETVHSDTDPSARPTEATVAANRHLLIGVLVDGLTKYGRSILRGVTDYSNLEHRWLLFKDLNHLLVQQAKWPKFDGIIFGGAKFAAVERCYRECPNIVACSGSANPARSLVVSVDSHALGVEAAHHLISCRLHNFGFYGTSSGLTGKARLDGFRRVLAGHGHSVMECPVQAPNAYEWMSHSHRPELVAWLRTVPKPIGIMAYDDFVAHDLAETCLEARLDVPNDVAIVGVNNDELMCESAWPPLSSVETDHRRVGFQAARVLDKLLRGEAIPASQRQLLLPPLGVVPRQSANILLLGDEHLVAAMHYIRDHACNPCSVQDVLRAVPVNRRWLERQFISKVGRTPHDEIRRVRIERAQQLLTDSALNLRQIATKCGFDELKSFYVAFRAVTATTPAALRRLQKQSPQDFDRKNRTSRYDRKSVAKQQ